jgi:hypothetical protein
MELESVVAFVAERGWRLRPELEERFGPGESLDMTLKYLVEKRKLVHIKFAVGLEGHSEAYYIPVGGNR